MDFTVDERSQSFATPRKHYHSVTTHISDKNMFDQVQLGFDTLQFKQYNTTCMKHHKPLHP